jgi:hypothetical protein
MGRRGAYFPIVLVLAAVALLPDTVARAGNAPEEGPIEIQSCQTISQPGSYKVVNNLIYTGSGTCLTIAASFVTIDLAGFTISSAHEIGGAIQAQSPLMGIAVRNGSISNFAGGVDLSSASGSIVEGLRIGGSGRSGIAGINANGIVKNNTVTAYNDGISATGTVTGNDVSASRGVGITIGQGSTVIGNTVTNSLTGITVDCPSNVTDNTAVGSERDNLVLNGQGCNNTNNVAPTIP